MTQPKSSFESNAGKSFDLGDVISVYHGVLVSPNAMDGVYQTLDFLTGEALMTEALMTHHLPTVADFCRPYIEKQFPEITQIDTATLQDKLQEYEDTSEGRQEAVKQWVAEQADLIGKRSVDLVPLTEEQKQGFGQYMIDNSLLARTGTNAENAPDRTP